MALFRYFLLFEYFQYTLTGSYLPKCEENGTCEFNRLKTVPSCYCDEECIYYMDCCKEYVVDHNTENVTRNVADEGCILITDQGSVPSERVGAFMVSRCEKSNTPCKITEDFKSMVPVSNSKKVYLNNECAICNGVFEFRFWKAIYSFPNEEDLFKLSRMGLINENVLAFVRNKSSSFTYGLEFRPPLEFRPRLCPNGMSRMGHDELQGSNIIYQNPVLCKDKFIFKNIESCVKDGCCITSNNIWCIDYSMNLYDDHDDHDEIRGGTNTIQAVIDFDGHESNKLSSQKIETNQEHVIYKNMVVHMITELYVGLNKTDIYFDDCVQGLLLYLGSTDFKIESLYPTYTIGHTENDTYAVLHHFQSFASLNVAQMEELLHLEFNFTCEDTKLEMMIKGNTKVFEANNVYDYFNNMGIGLLYSRVQQVHIRLNSYMIETSTMENICSCLELKLQEIDAKQKVQVKCSGVTGLNVNVNGAEMLGNRNEIMTLSLQLMIMIALAEFSESA